MAFDAERLRQVLREERERRGVTLEDVGALVRKPKTGEPVPRQTVYEWESGRNALPLYALPAYEAALKLPIEVFVGGDVPLPAGLSPDRAALARQVLAVLARGSDDDVAGLRWLMDRVKLNP